jgi:hypothetical protein
MCKNISQCGICSAIGHATLDCFGREDCTKHKCIPCAGKHPSWSPDCPERKKKKEEARIAYNNRPTHFQDRTAHPYPAPPTPTVAPAPTAPASIAPASAAPAPAPAPASAPAPTLASTSQTRPPATFNILESWQTVQPRKAGRPCGSTKASRNTADIRAFTR